jgi:hypothetical protein
MLHMCEAAVNMLNQELLIINNFSGWKEYRMWNKS